MRLGQLIAGVAHEINSPLGAIKSQNESFLRDIERVFHNMPVLFANMPMELIRKIDLLVDKAVENKKMLSPREERDLKKKVKSLFEKIGINNSTRLASTYINFADEKAINEYLPILKHEKALEITGLISKLVNLKKWFINNKKCC